MNNEIKVKRTAGQNYKINRVHIIDNINKIKDVHKSSGHFWRPDLTLKRMI